MQTERWLWCLMTLMVLSTQSNSERQVVYFSDANHCDQTYTVARDGVIQIEEKRSNDSASNAFTDCSLRFRAGNLADKLCMKITTLTFTSNKLQFQYFKSLDPSVGSADLVYDSSNPASTPVEVCDNEYEISMKLHALDASATLSDVDLSIEVYNMQGTRRVAYMDTDCGLTYKMRDSIVFVQNTDPTGPNTLRAVCQLYFDYVGTNPNYTVCINYQKTMGTCGYELKVFDGSVSGSTLAHTYTCSNDQPQQWCGTGSSIYLELIVSGNDLLPVGVFAVQVKDESKGLPTGPADPTDPNDKSGFSTGEILAIANLSMVSIILLFIIFGCVFWNRIWISPKCSKF